MERSTHQLWAVGLALAAERGEPCHSGHLFVALWRESRQVASLLGASARQRDTAAQMLLGGSEAPAVMRLIKKRMEDLSASWRSPEAEDLCLLLALLHAQRSVVRGTLRQLGYPLRTLQRAALRALAATSQIPQQQVFAPPPSSASLSCADRLAQLRARAPTLASLCQLLPRPGAAAEADEVACREGELLALVDILGKRHGNNPLLLGPAGIGKTALVEALAQRLLRQDPSVAHLGDKTIVTLEMGSLLAGTELRGALGQRLARIKDELAQGAGQIIVFIDEIHTLVTAGGAEGGGEVAQELKGALARGRFPCIGATTEEEYKRFLEKDAALTRRFTPLLLSVPSGTQALQMVQRNLAAYSAHHGIAYEPKAVAAAVSLTERFVHSRCQPDKSLAILDLAGARARRLRRPLVDLPLVADIVSEVSAVPKARLLAEVSGDYLAAAPQLLAGRFFDQAGTLIPTLVAALRRALLLRSGTGPLGATILYGPKGSGKHTLARALAALLYGDEQAVVELNLAEYSESHSAARLLGAQPGYVGYGEGGVLTEAIRKRPHQVLLLSQVQAAAAPLHSLLEQILRQGTLQDTMGRAVSFAHAWVVILVDVAGGDDEREQPASGFRPLQASAALPAAALCRYAQRLVPPQLWQQIPERLGLPALRSAGLRWILERRLAAQLAQVAKAHHLQVRCSPQAITHALAWARQTKALSVQERLRQASAALLDPLLPYLGGAQVEPGTHLELALCPAGEQIAVRSVASLAHCAS